MSNLLPPSSEEKIKCQVRPGLYLEQQEPVAMQRAGVWEELINPYPANVENRVSS
jgi:hypothetical protein